MQSRKFVYPVLFAYEIIRLAVLFRQGASSITAGMPLVGYAGIAILCLVPVLFAMLFLDEQQFSLWLPLLVLIKFLGISASVLFIARTLPLAVRFGFADQFALLGTVLSAAFFILSDASIGIFCYRRSKSLCK